MENKYFFILGRNPTLSVAEIIGVLYGWITKFHLCELTEKFLILETSAPIDAKKLQEKLGGTIKIGKIISRINTNDITNNTNIRTISDKIRTISENLKKVYFGFSFYQQKINKQELKRLALNLKRELKERGLASRWVESKENILSSVIVQKNKLLTSGAEFCFLITRTNTEKTTDKHGNSQYKSASSPRQSTYVGKTLSCQEFKEYEKLDFGRPKRLIDQLGMMPPKLAKIMINLALESRTPKNASPSEGTTLLDPFCGSGTILQEAVLMGYKNIVGADINQQAIDSTKENLKWLIDNYKLSTINYKLFQTDVKEISRKILPNSINAIVTEPYLGPIKMKNIENRIKNIENELSDLYLETFKEFKKILKPDGKIVIILPIFSKNFGGKPKIFSQKIEHLAETADSAVKADNIILSQFILPDLKKSGWQVINPIPEDLRKNPAIKITERNSIIYSRPDQKVLREIFIFKQ